MSSNPLVDDILSDWEALQREKHNRLLRPRETPKNAPPEPDLIPQWIPIGYELRYAVEACACCGALSPHGAGIFFSEQHLKNGAKRLTRVDPTNPRFIPGLPRESLPPETHPIPACADCLGDILSE